MFKVGDFIIRKSVSNGLGFEATNFFKRNGLGPYQIYRIANGVLYINLPGFEPEWKIDPTSENWSLYKKRSEGVFCGSKYKIEGNTLTFENGEKMYLNKQNKLYAWSQQDV